MPVDHPAFDEWTDPGEGLTTARIHAFNAEVEKAATPKTYMQCMQRGRARIRWLKGCERRQRKAREESGIDESWRANEAAWDRFVDIRSRIIAAPAEGLVRMGIKIEVQQSA